MLRVREGRDADAPALAALYALLDRPVVGDAAPMTAEIVRRDVLSPETPMRVLVAERDGGVEGMAVHLFAYESAWAVRGRYLQDLAVFPEARRRGVARALIARLAALTSAEGGRFLWLVNGGALAEARPIYDGLCDVSEDLRAYALTRDAFAALAAEGAARG